MTAKRSTAAQCVTLTFTIWLFGFLLHPPVPRTSWDALKRYADLPVYDGDAASRERFARLVDDAYPFINPGPSNHRYAALLTIEERGTARFLLIDEEIHPSPGGSVLEMILLDAAGSVISRSRHSMGGRTGFESARILRYPGTEIPILAVHTGGTGMAHTQHYGILEDKLVFLFAPALDFGWHGYWNAKTHALPCRWSKDQWELWMRTRDPVRIHAGLAWLSGRHSRFCDLPSGIADPREIRTRIDRLAASEDLLLRRAAILAAQP